MSSMNIYYSCNQYPTYYESVWCSRWTENGWNLTIEFPADTSQRNNIFRYTVPGACKELYNILGVPHYIDTTWTSGNTLIISPLEFTGLSGLCSKKKIAVKSIIDEHLNNQVYNVKIEGYIMED